MTTFSAAIVEGLGFGGPYIGTRTYQQAMIEALGLGDLPSASGQFSAQAIEGARFTSAARGGFSLTVIDSFGIGGSPVYVWRPGAVIVEGVGIGASVTPNGVYHLTITAGFGIGDQPNVGHLGVVMEGLDLSSAVSAKYLLSIIERIAASVSLGTQGSYNVVTIEAAQFQDAIANAWGAETVESAGIGGQLLVKYIALASLAEGVGVADDPNTYTHMVFHPAIVEELELTDTEIVQGIYQGSITEGANIYVLYAAPSGSTTAWAMNTRTNALTEYKNWIFNSFASMGRKYIGASQFGLFELNGARDNEENTIADMAGGYLEMGDGKLSGLKGVYLGLNGQGTYFLRLDAGDGRYYLYQFVSQPGLMTSKVIVGKGLRSRWLRWELVTTGPDFDLSSIEFVPMISGRRV